MTRIPPVSAGRPAMSLDRDRVAVPLWRSGAVLLLGLLVWVFSWTTPRSIIPPQTGVEMHLPGFLDLDSGYVGENAPVTEPERLILPKDTEFARKNYRETPSSVPIFCSIVLSGAGQQSIHRPEVCLVAQGWSITNQENIPIPLASGHELTVRNLTISRSVLAEGKSMTETEYNMYWFVGEKITTPSHFMRIFLSSWDRIVHNRAHRWAYVTVSMPITGDWRADGLDAAQTRTLLIRFIRQIVPYFQKSEMPPERTSAVDQGAANRVPPTT